MNVLLFMVRILVAIDFWSFRIFWSISWLQISSCKFVSFNDGLYPCIELANHCISAVIFFTKVSSKRTFYSILHLKCKFLMLLCYYAIWTRVKASSQIRRQEYSRFLEVDLNMNFIYSFWFCVISNVASTAIRFISKTYKKVINYNSFFRWLSKQVLCD